MIMLHSNEMQHHCRRRMFAAMHRGAPLARHAQYRYKPPTRAFTLPPQRRTQGSAAPKRPGVAVAASVVPSTAKPATLHALRTVITMGLGPCPPAAQPLQHTAPIVAPRQLTCTHTAYPGQTLLTLPHRSVQTRAGALVQTPPTEGCSVRSPDRVAQSHSSQCGCSYRNAGALPAALPSGSSPVRQGATNPHYRTSANSQRKETAHVPSSSSGSSPVRQGPTTPQQAARQQTAS